MYKAILELQKFECENTGLNQLSTQSFAYSVSPNPAETWVRVASEAKIEKLELIDLSGRILYTQNIEQNNEYLFMDVSQIKSGIYILRAKSGNLYQTHKLIKQ
jgi:hypothetical protein